MSDDQYHLDRFLDAQAKVYETVLEELRAGQKCSHWIWFIFPQIQGLGRSTTAQYYALTSLDEARAYLSHPILGPRLRECSQLVAATVRSVDDIFGYPDNLKFCSSMTLFAQVAPNDVFDGCLRVHFNGEPDPLTLDRL
ncbi:MAG TPA: DUF1810 domain-containing protein [Noviherbaspirillum sp.]|nr:DUF1810 domain-containing protein [Noviherbaspirillum sp.]